MIPIQYALRRRMMAGSSKKKIIKFTLDGYAISNTYSPLLGDYWAEEGMTWAEWCDSDYNKTPNKAIYIGTDFNGTANRVILMYDSTVLTLEESNYNTAVSGDDVIVADRVYYGYLD